KQGPWTDVYALAAVLYAAVTRKAPPTSVARIIKDPLVPLAQRGLAGYSGAFLAAIDRGLQVRPEDRPQSIAELRDLLGVERAPASRGTTRGDTAPSASTARSEAARDDDATLLVPRSPRIEVDA